MPGPRVRNCPMKICLRLLLVLPLTLSPAIAQQPNDYDYFQANRTMIRNGAQALITCNGLFTSNRTLPQVFDQELAILGEPVGSIRGGDYVVDTEGQTIAVGGGASGPVMRAAFREGIGCVIMSPDQDFDDIDSLPTREIPYPDMDPATTPWPNGDLVEDKKLPSYSTRLISVDKIAASTPDQITLNFSVDGVAAISPISSPTSAATTTARAFPTATRFPSNLTEGATVARGFGGRDRICLDFVRRYPPHPAPPPSRRLRVPLHLAERDRRGA